MSKNVCRHFIAGGCYRKDCLFYHPSGGQDTPLCRYYLSDTGCTRSGCPFRHPDNSEAALSGPPLLTLASFLPPIPPLPQQAALSNSDAECTGGDLDADLEASQHHDDKDTSESQFPSLPGASPVKKSALGSDGLARRLGMDSLRNAFPGIPDSTISQCLTEAAGVTSAASLLLSQLCSVRPLEGALGPVRLAKPLRHSSPESVTDTLSASFLASAKVLARGLERVETGAGLAKLYAEVRREAEALARARNEAFERAKRAYLSNDSAGARRFSAQGRELDVRMQAAHRAAAEKIFKERGERGVVEVPTGVGGVPMRAYVLDLHGLHLVEAGALVIESLSKIKALVKSVEFAALLTGARHHSASLGRGGGAIGLGLADTLAEMGYRCCQPTEGVLVVKV